MPREPENPAKLLEWAPRAKASYSATLAYIADQDPVTSQQVRDRVEQALKHIAAFPAIGTPGMRRGIRRFAIPNTGHVINYSVLPHAIRIHAWYRARRRAPAN